MFRLARFSAPSLKFAAPSAPSSIPTEGLTLSRLGSDNQYEEVDVADLVKGKNIFTAIPAAFTPVCTTKHLPGYNKLAEDFKAKGVENIYVVSVNDAWTMAAFQKHLGADKLVFLADQNGDFSKAMNMLGVEAKALGNPRSFRYSLISQDGNIGFFASDHVDTLTFEKTTPEAVLEQC